MTREELARRMWEAAEKASGQRPFDNPWPWEHETMRNVRNRYLAAADVALEMRDYVAATAVNTPNRQKLAVELRKATGTNEPWEHWPNQVRDMWLRVADAAIIQNRKALGQAWGAFLDVLMTSQFEGAPEGVSMLQEILELNPKLRARLMTAVGL